MVRAFIGGKEVKKEDLGKYEIKSEKLNRILVEKKYANTEEKKRA